MGRKGRVRLRKLRDELVRAHPSITDPDAAIGRGAVVVDGRVVSNPASLVREGAAIALRIDKPLRGEAKLGSALRAFRLAVEGRIALDVGAAAGGFTRVLLEAGARRVYAVDAGYGQLGETLQASAEDGASSIDVAAYRNSNGQVVRLDPTEAKAVVDRSMKAAALRGVQLWIVAVDGPRVTVSATMSVQLMVLGTATLTESRSAIFAYGQ